jgi:hypothetical protein
MRHPHFTVCATLISRYPHPHFTVLYETASRVIRPMPSCEYECLLGAARRAVLRWASSGLRLRHFPRSDPAYQPSEGSARPAPPLDLKSSAWPRPDPQLPPAQTLGPEFPESWERSVASLEDISGVASSRGAEESCPSHPVRRRFPLRGGPSAFPCALGRVSAPLPHASEDPSLQVRSPGRGPIAEEWGFLPPRNRR